MHNKTGMNRIKKVQEHVQRWFFSHRAHLESQLTPIQTYIEIIVNSTWDMSLLA